MKISISLPNDVLDQVAKAAETYGLNRSAYICMCVKQQLAQDTVLQKLPQMLDLMSEAIKVTKEAKAQQTQQAPIETTSLYADATKYPTRLDPYEAIGMHPSDF